MLIMFGWVYINHTKVNGKKIRSEYYELLFKMKYEKEVK